MSTNAKLPHEDGVSFEQYERKFGGQLIGRSLQERARPEKKSRHAACNPMLQKVRLLDVFGNES
jgi:hypothetical protein